MNTKTSFSPTSIKITKKWNFQQFKTRIEVSLFTFVIIIFSLLTDYYLYLFLMYLIAFTHEMSHVFWAMIFKAKVSRIKFLPFGFYAEIEDLYKLPSYKEFIVLVSGPASYFISFIVLFLLKSNSLISSYTYHIAQNSNLIMALFNLIPYYPLDGARLLEIFIARFLSEKKTRIVRLVISFISLILISIFLYKNNQTVLLVYLGLQYITELLLFKKQYQAFLYQRLISGPPSKIKLTNKDEVYRYYHTYRLENKKIIEEKVIISRLIVKMRKNDIKHVGFKLKRRLLLKFMSKNERNSKYKLTNA